MKRAHTTPVSLTLREAARIVAEGSICPCGCGDEWEPSTCGACTAILYAEALPGRPHWVSYGSADNAMAAFAEAMRVNQQRQLGKLWWRASENNRTVRVLALLFAAEMEERP